MAPNRRGSSARGLGTLGAPSTTGGCIVYPSRLHRLAALGAAAVMLAASPAAIGAVPPCDSISGGDPIIYGAGATGTRDLVGAIAVQLENAPNPVWVVYQSFGSCTGTDALTGVGPPTITGTADY